MRKLNIKRPLPPEALFSPDGVLDSQCLPAPDVAQWVEDMILAESGPLHNPDHAHLRHAHLGFLWTNAYYERQGVRVAGMAEIPMFRCGMWQKVRQEQQMRAWFGDVPDFLITLDAMYAEAVGDATWCALVEHELYHCAQEKDAFGSPRFLKGTGLPKFTMRGHDVEEFVGVVRRYGAGNAAGATVQLIDAAKRLPEVAHRDIAHACGTCLAKVA